MIFAMRQIQEKCREQNQDLYMVFIDLTKVFDSVNRTELWKLLAKVGRPDTFVDVIRSFHDGTMVRVQKTRGQNQMRLVYQMAPNRVA